MKRRFHHCLRVLCVLSVLCVLRSSPAAVIYSGLVNEPIPMTIDGLYLNPLTGTSSTEPTGPWLNPFFGGVDVGSNDLLFPAITGVDQIINLASGQLIDSSLTYTTDFSGSSTHTAAVVTPNKFTLGTPGYLGFRFKPTLSSTDFFYGWANVTFSNTGAGTLHSYAYEDTANSPIAAGFSGSAAPEPGRVMLILFGALGFMARRRRSCNCLA